MDTVVTGTLQTLRDIQGIQGSFVVGNDDGQLLARDLPRFIDESALAQVGPRICRLLEVIESEQPMESSALRFADHRLDIRRLESIKDGTEVIGNRTRVKVVKNKCAPPFRMAEFDIVYGKGISREGSVLDVAVDLGIAKKSGAWYTYEGEQLGQGRENAKQFLRESPELMIELHQRIRNLVAEKAALAVETPIGAGGLADDDEPISLD